MLFHLRGFLCSSFKKRAGSTRISLEQRTVQIILVVDCTALYRSDEQFTIHYIYVVNNIIMRYDYNDG